MKHKHSLIVEVSLGVVLLSVSLVLAQSKKAENPHAQEQRFNPYNEANLKFDILESQIQTLRKKMQLQNKRKVERTKEWNEHYEKVKQHIEAWDDFVDSYDIE